jgi:hypothetical protein
MLNYSPGDIKAGSRQHKKALYRDNGQAGQLLLPHLAGVANQSALP